jgi:ribosomal protein L13E
MISARDEERERYLELVKENKRMEAVIFNQKEFNFDKVIYPADKRELNAYRELKIKYPEIKKIGESKEMEMKNDVKKGRGFSR